MVTHFVSLLLWIKCWFLFLLRPKYLLAICSPKKQWCVHLYIYHQGLTFGLPNNHKIQWWQTAPAAVKNLNISFKCCFKYKFRESFEICSSWGFQNTPNMLKLIEFWLRYMRSKTNDMILKNSSKLIEIDENLMKTKLFVTKIILVTLEDINVNKNHF